MFNLKNAVAGLVLGLGIATIPMSASARTYSGNYDPDDFLGTFTFTILDACLSLPDGVYPVAGSCDPAQAITQLDADLYQGGVLLAHFVYLPPGTVTPNLFSMLNGDVNALDTPIIGPRFNEVVFGNVPYWLQFGIHFNPEGGAGTPFINLYDGTCTSNNGTIHSGCTPNPVPLLVANTVNFIAVPEPGTLLLLVGALGAGLVARRRAKH